MLQKVSSFMVMSVSSQEKALVDADFYYFLMFFYDSQTFPLKFETTVKSYTFRQIAKIRLSGLIVWIN